MKRSLSLVVTLAAAIVIGQPTLHAQEFTNPILIGGDDTAGPPSNQQTEATTVKFFIHPKAPAGNQNFVDDTGKIEPDEFEPIYLDDVVATPGHVGTQSLSSDSPMIDHPAARVTTNGSSFLPTLNPIGPSDVTATINGIPIRLGVDLALSAKGRNETSHRLMLGDLRAEAPAGEFSTLFGVDPLESMLIGGAPVGIIGNAADVGPYEADTYPATIISNGPLPAPFQWCAVPRPLMPTFGYNGCKPIFGVWPNTELGNDLKYTEVFLYDVANLGEGFVAPSYDPLALRVDAELFAAAGTSPLIVAGVFKLNSFAQAAAYYSPMTFFRKVQEGTGNPTRYRFSGYTSWEMPDLNAKKYWPFIVSNWMLPMATNPVAVEAMDLKGASSTPSYPDTDFATLYQTTLFDLDQDVYDVFGRPAVMGDGGFVTYRDIIGICTQPAPACGAFAKLTDADFPDHVISLVLGWKQMKKWAVGGDYQPYETVNPSHVFDPEWGAIVGPGAYHTAVLTDFAGDPAKRKQLLVVPSTADDPTSPDHSVIYFVDPDGTRLVGRFAKSEIDYNAPSCTTNWQYQELPLILPEWKAIPKPRISVDPVTTVSGNYVPYDVKSGNLDGDACEDFVVTWRGKDVLADSAHPDQVVFDDGQTVPQSNMFAHDVTVVLRKDIAGVCEFQLPQDTTGDQYPGSLIPKKLSAPSAHMWFASATIGDFDGDGLNDVAVGDARAEYTNGVDPTAYAWVYHHGSTVPFSSIDATRVRVGFHVGDPDMGVASIDADRNPLGPDALAQVNGRPLMLPEIGCPDNDSASPTPVGSVFESYLSIFSNLASKWAVVKMPNIFDVPPPFVDQQNRPIPERCATPPEKCKQGVWDLPFYVGDDCCKDHCAEVAAAGGFKNWLATSPCAQYLLKYANLSCGMFHYGEQLYNLCDPNASLPNKDAGSRMLAEAEDGGDTDFALSFRPDTVVGYEGRAIGIASAMRFAQAAAPAGGMLDVQGADELRDVPIRSYGEALQVAVGPFDTLNIPLEKLLDASLFSLFASDPEMMRQIDQVKAGGEIARLGEIMDAYLHDRLIGPPRGFEDLFIRPMVMTTIVAANEARSARASSNTSTGRWGFLSGAGCTLAAQPLVQKQIKIVPKEDMEVQSTGPMIPFGGSTGCGNGFITGNEQCDPQSNEPNYGCDADEYCFAGDANGTPVACTCVKCGDQTVQNGEAIVNGVVQAYEEACDGAPCQNGVACTNMCTCYVTGGQPQVCGNGIAEQGEECNEPGLSCDASHYCNTTTCKCIMKMVDKVPDWGTVPGHHDFQIAKCGDGVKASSEECDEPGNWWQFNQNSPCYNSINPVVSEVCGDDCECHRPSCGDGHITDPGNPPWFPAEPCDPGSPVTQICPSGQICQKSPSSAQCECVGGGFVPPPPLNYKIKLPRGRLMPGYREMTAVVMKTPKGTTTSACNPSNGQLDPGEDCDLFGIPESTDPNSAWQHGLQTQCTDPPLQGQTPSTCNINCHCEYDSPWCVNDPNALCTSNAQCEASMGAGSVCDVSCRCVPPAGGGVPADTPNSEDILASTQNDCWIHCDTFSGDAEAEIYRGWNDRVRSVTGRNDDLFCEPEQKVTVLCRVGAGSAPEVTNLSLSLSGTPLPDSAQNLRPYMLVQRTGSQFVDSGTLQYKEFTLVEQALRILPVEGLEPAAQKQTQIVLPDLSSSPDLAPLEGISPMATTSVAYGAGGAVAVNNMIQHEVFSVMPGQDYSITIGGSAQTIKAQTVDIPDGAAIVVHKTTSLLPPDCASWTGVEGYQGCPNIEDRQFDGQQILSILESNKAAFSTIPTAAIYTDLPWEANLNYNFNLVQSVYGKAGEPEPQPTQVSYAFLAGKPLAMGAGGGCGCYVANGSATLGSIMPALIAMLVPIGGIAIGAARRRRRR